MAVRLDRGLISRRGSTATLTLTFWVLCKTDSTHKTHLPGSQRELYNLLGLSSFSSCSLVRILRQNSTCHFNTAQLHDVLPCLHNRGFQKWNLCSGLFSLLWQVSPPSRNVMLTNSCWSFYYKSWGGYEYILGGIRVVNTGGIRISSA